MTEAVTTDAVDQPLEEDQPKPGLGRQFLNFFKDLRGEAIMLFYALSNFLPVIFLQHFVLVQVCKREFPSVDCSQPFNSTVEADIQHSASNLLLWLFVVRTVPSVFILMFWGPWSDLHGRLLPTLAPMIGNIITYTIFTLANEFETWPLYVLILAAIPSGLTGDYSGFMMGYFGWVNDAHSPETLTTKMSTVNGVETVMLIIAPFVGSQLYKRFSYTAVFATSTVLMSFGCVLVCVYVTDDRYRPRASLKVLIMDMVDCRKAFGIFKTLLVKRENHKTLHINLMLLSILPVALSFFGHQDIIYLLLRLVAGFDVYTFSFYSMAQGLSNAIGFLVLAPILIHLAKLSETAMGFLSNIAFMVYYIATGVVKSMVVLFALCALQILGVISLLTPRAFVSHNVSSEETGKAMSLVGLSQAIGHVLGTVIGRQVYKHTLHQLPGLFHMIAGLIVITSVAINGFIYLDTKRIQKTVDKEN